MKTIFQTAKELGKFLEKKNKDYGSAFAKVSDFLKILYPNGIKPEEYTYVMLTVRIFDKLMRISQGALTDSFVDITGYGILGVWLRQSISSEQILVISANKRKKRK